MLTLKVGQQEDTVKLMETLSSMGLSMWTMSMSRDSSPYAAAFLDVYSFASEYPYRIDFFGDETIVCVRLK